MARHALALAALLLFAVLSANDAVPVFEPNLALAAVNNFTVTGGATNSLFCSRSVLVMGNRGLTSSPTAETTADLVVPANSFLQFELSFGCAASVPQGVTVSVQVSTNSGASYGPALPACTSALCTTFTFPHSISYRSAEFTSGWTRITLPIPEGPRVRVRWSSNAVPTTSWAVANIALTSDCPGACNNAGGCLNGTCVCDSGFELADNSCRPRIPISAGLRETFDSELNRTMWPVVLGGSLKSNVVCSRFASGSALVMDAQGTRALISAAFDARSVSFVQFLLQMGQNGPCLGPSSSTENMIVAYSSDNGITYKFITAPFYLSYSYGDMVLFNLPPEAKTASLRLLFMQFDNSGANSDIWALDDIIAATTPSLAPTSLFDALASTDRLLANPSLVSWPNARIEPFCGQTALHFFGSSGFQYLDTGLLSVGDRSVIQFDISLGCAASPPASHIGIQVERWSGSSWTRVLPDQCNYLTSSCTSWSWLDGHRLSSSIYGAGWSRVTLAIPSVTSNTRYRLFMSSRGSSTISVDWAVKNLYIGAGCGAEGCSGHGSCIAGRCVCDDNHEGPLCTPIANALPADLRESFANATINPLRWARFVGGSINTDAKGCGAISDSSLAHFDLANARFLMTEDIDLTKGGAFLEFLIRLGPSTSFCSSPSSTSEGIVVAYSTNGGVTWQFLHSVEYYITSTSFRTIDISGISAPSTRFLFWQPTNSGDQADEWAIDNIYIGYKSPTAPKAFAESFAQSPNEDFWTFLANEATRSHCRAPSAAVITSSTSITSALTTRDLQLSLDNVPVVIARFANASLPEWTNVTGSRVSSECGLRTTGFVFDMGGSGIPRVAETADFNLTTTNLLISFFFAFGAGGCDAPDTSSVGNDEDVYFEYSTNGGQSYVILRRLTLASFINGALATFSVDSYPALKSGPVRFRWMQKSYSTEAAKADVWALSSFTIQGVPLSLPMVQFEYTIGCEDNSSPEFVLEQSNSRGSSWSTCTRCNPLLDGNCRVWCQHDCTFFTGENRRGEWTSVSLPLANANMARLQWRARSSSGTVGIRNVVISQTCPNRCMGHGVCLNGACVCSDGYRLSAAGDCVPSVQLPREFFENFDAGAAVLNATKWEFGTGAILSGSGDCGVLGSGSKYFFTNSGDRFLVTTDFNTTTARFLSFLVRLGDGSSSCSSPTSTSEGVVVGYSVNGGLEVNLLTSIYYYQSSLMQVVVQLPDEAKTESTRFMFSQGSNSGLGQDEWTLDEIYIGPATANLPREISTSFADGASTSQFALWTQGVAEQYCGRPSMHFRGASGTQVLETTSTDLPAGSVLQFDLSLGCSQASATFSVVVEYTDNDGVSWNMLVTRCNPLLDGNCRTFASITGSQFYTYEFALGYTRVVLPVSQSPVRGRRFRIRPSSISGNLDWAVTNFYLGAGCGTQPCAGHGSCVAGQCVCDNGYTLSGSACVSNTTLAKELRETFSGVIDSALFVPQSTAGSIQISPCGIIAEGRSLFFNGIGTRRLETVDLDLSDAKFVEFDIQFGSSGGSFPCVPPSSTSRGVVVAYSNNGGLTFTYITELPYYNYRDRATVSFGLPEAAKTPATRILWVQPEVMTSSDQVWQIDNILIAGSSVGRPTSVEQRFNVSALPTNEFGLAPNGVIENFCGRNSIHFTGSTGIQYLATSTLNIPASNNPVIQFDITLGCDFAPGTAFRVILESSDSPGSWDTVITQCNPNTNGNCRSWSWTGGSDFNSNDYSKGWYRVTIPLPSTAPGRRYRWRSNLFRQSMDWAIANIYIGSACNGGCGNSGMCMNGTCVCNRGFVVGGPSNRCVPASAPTFLRDELEDEILPTRWAKVFGGQIVAPTGCGTVSALNALLFDGAGSRLLESVDINTLQSSFLSFQVQLGRSGSTSACSSPTTTSEGVIVSFSTDGGVTWTLFNTLFYLSYTSATNIMWTLPAGAISASTRFQWYQTTSSGRGGAVWLVDSVFVGPSTNSSNAAVIESPLTVGDSMSGLTLWPNAILEPFCGRESLHFRSASGMQYLLTTTTNLPSDSIIQFDFNMGCGGAPFRRFKVLLESSDNNGASWSQVIVQCNPFSDSSCRRWVWTGGSNFNSADYSSKWWTVTIPLPSVARGRIYRLNADRNDGVTQEWGLSNLYLGGGCGLGCSGHGRCSRGQCVCDAGYTLQVSSGSCVPRSANLTSEIRDNFNTDILLRNWDYVRGGALAVNGGGCGIVSDGKSMHFGSTDGIRMISTVDMNPSSLKFIQYLLQLGDLIDDSSSSQCTEPSFSEGVVVAYSFDGGISFTVLDTLTSARRPRFFSTGMPDVTGQTMIRFLWWQIANSGAGFDRWNLEDVYIGPPALADITSIEDNFDAFNEANFLFVAGGSVQSSYCSSDGGALVVAEQSVQERRVTTQDMKLSADEVVVLANPLTAQPTASEWLSATGYTASRLCGIPESGWVFNQNGTLRQATTVDMDLRVPNLVLRFAFGFGAQGCDPAETTSARDEDVYVEYSTDLGRTFATLRRLTGAQSLTISIELDSVPAVKTNSTRFRWRQNLYTMELDNSDVWAISGVQIRGVPRYPYMVQFDVNMGCPTSSPYTAPMDLSYSTNLGSSWTQVASSCTPNSCNGQWFEPAVFAGSRYRNWTRMTYDLGLAPSTQMRLQWRQNAVAGGLFALDNIYVGQACPSFCSGRGRCHANGFCDCDNGYTGSGCEVSPQLPTSLADNFERGSWSSQWIDTDAVVVGGCSAGVNGLLFTGAGRRQATTQDLDTTGATTFTFNDQFCTTSTTEYSVSYSTNGGIYWTVISRFSGSSGSSAASRSLTLPSGARTKSTRFRFYQTLFNSGGNSVSFMVDNIEIGGVCLKSNPCKDPNSVCLDATDGSTSCVCKPQFTLLNGTCEFDRCGGVVCSSTDPCNGAGTCNPATGLCSLVPMSGPSCNDRDETTKNDVCVAGKCVGVSKCANVTCVPVSACYSSSRCIPTTGLCQDVAAPDGTPCDDGDGTTFNETCRAGACSGLKDKCIGVKCNAPGQCQTAVLCDSLTGSCVPSNKADATPCDNGDNTTIATCRSGLCVGVSKCSGVVCRSASQCSISSCNAFTGRCVENPAPLGTSCNDNNSTTERDSCDASGVCKGLPSCSLITCVPLDSCHIAGTCLDGVCSNPQKDDFSVCDDGSALTVNDRCVNGVCRGIQDRCLGVTCAALDECHDVGLCTSDSGTCSNPQKVDGSSCSAGACQSGKCVATCSASDCVPPSQCYSAGCDFAGQCNVTMRIDSTLCDDQNVTTINDMCTNGVCRGSPRCAGVTCPAASACKRAGVCDAFTGLCVQQSETDGTVCDDGRANTLNDRCNAGICSGTLDKCFNVSCSSTVLGQCDASVSCVEGQCVVARQADGVTCDDGDRTTFNDKCASGTCIGSDVCLRIVCKPSQCRLTAVCVKGVCFDSLDSQSDGTTCDDGRADTINDACQLGSCIGQERTTLTRPPTSTSTTSSATGSGSGGSSTTTSTSAGGSGSSSSSTSTTARGGDSTPTRTTTTTTATLDPNNDQSKGSDSGKSNNLIIIIVIAVAAVLVVIILVGGIVYYKLKKAKMAEFSGHITHFGNPTYEIPVPAASSAPGGARSMRLDFDEPSPMGDSYYDNPLARVQGPAVTNPAYDNMRDATEGRPEDYLDVEVDA